MQDPWTHHTNWPRVIGMTLLVVGVLALILGIAYMTIPAHSLPPLMGRLKSPTAHRTKRGEGGLVVGIVLAAVGGFLVARSRRPD
jgi:hypothetical protein